MKEYKLRHIPGTFSKTYHLLDTTEGENIVAVIYDIKIAMKIMEHLNSRENVSEL